MSTQLIPESVMAYPSDLKELPNPMMNLLELDLVGRLPSEGQAMACGKMHVCHSCPLGHSRDNT